MKCTLFAAAALLIAQAPAPATGPRGGGPETPNGAKAHGPTSAPASRPALARGGTGQDVQGDLTLIFEIDEHHLKTQESWTLSNSSGKQIEPRQLVFVLPEQTRRLRLDDNIKGFTAPEAGRRFLATQPLQAGNHGIGAAYLTKLNGDSVTIQRRIPVNLRTTRVIIENVSGLKFSSSIPHESRVRDLNGLEFAIFTLGPIPAGGTLEFSFDDLPSNSTAPAYIALAMCFALVGWMVFALFQPAPRNVQTMGVLSAEARRDRLVKAIELLERDRAEDRIKPKRYTRRYEELMTDLADVLREVERTRQTTPSREVKETS